MNKKGVAGIVIVIIFFILIIGAIITLIIVAEQKGWFNKNNPEQETKTIEFYIRGNDLDDNSKFVEGNIELSWMDYDKETKTNYTKKIEGKLVKDAYTPFIVPSDRIITARCWSDDYYLVKAYHQFSPRDLEYNKSTMDCTMAKIGTLEIKKVSGGLSNKYNSLVLNITSKNGWWYKLGICESWSAGVIDIIPTSKIVLCDKGRWINYSHYYPENRSYEWLPEGIYRCGEDDERCEYVENSRCILPDENTPLRYEGLVDSCFYTATTLKPEQSYLFDVQIPTLDIKNQLDMVDFYFYDYDRRFDVGLNEWVWMTAYNGIDVGAEDFTFTVYYEE